MVTRDEVEARGRAGAGIIEQDDKHSLVRVLNLFDMYVVNDDKSVSPHLVNEGFWESWITTWMINNINPDTGFYDVGANTGYYGFLANELGANVSFVEPNPTYVEVLNRTLDSMDMQGEITLVQGAVGDKITTETLNIPRDLHGSASLRHIAEQWFPSTVDVAVRPFDKWFPTDPGSIIKVDVEGYEEKFWDGAQRFIQKSEPTIVLEYTPGAYGRDFLNKLQDYGDLKWINHQGQEEAVDQNTILSQADWIMLVVRKR